MPAIKCPFCDKNNLESQIIKETELFYILINILPLTKNHLMVVSKRHIRSENEFSKAEWLDYQTASSIAYAYIKNRSGQPMIFINAVQDQSVKHFHKHYIGGTFGVHGVDKALRTFLKNKQSSSKQGSGSTS